ncbi:Double-stranded RNA-binding domain (DsRBD)-containing protein [Euphorbia peplus]|nr:Double-stranded RNA-binding domain (DsRBD)-containing protein [Euphorbia peplus]
MMRDGDEMIPEQHQNDVLQTNIIDLYKFGERRKAPAKSKLQEICALNKWKPPFFQCCNQQGPPHLPLFSFKVTVEIGGEDEMCLECFGAPRPKKIMAAEDAAEGALWRICNKCVAVVQVCTISEASH